MAKACARLFGIAATVRTQSRRSREFRSCRCLPHGLVRRYRVRTPALLVYAVSSAIPSAEHAGGECERAEVTSTMSLFGWVAPGLAQEPKNPAGNKIAAAQIPSRAMVLAAPWRWAAPARIWATSAKTTNTPAWAWPARAKDF